MNRLGWMAFTTMPKTPCLLPLPKIPTKKQHSCLNPSASIRTALPLPRNATKRQKSQEKMRCIKRLCKSKPRPFPGAARNTIFPITNKQLNF